MYGPGDEDVEVAAAVVGAAHLLGARCPVGAWLPLALEAVAGPKLPEASRANALVILSALLYGAGETLVHQDSFLLNCKAHPQSPACSTFG